ncbi:MAG: cobalamin B12-binding domain-containing protein [Deltaproteobacteria bacterium]|nr:cobalamin B12-binding domain-containing protein [Deltaproteobacteria bacterium]
MRVLLVSPNREVSPDAVFPLGLAALAAVLESRGLTVKGTDLCFHPDWRAVLEQDLDSFRPDCIGLSIRNLDNVSYPRSIEYLPFIKEVVQVCRGRSSAPIVLGGAGFTLLPDRVLQYLAADYGIIGEGEQALVDLLARLFPGPPEKGAPFLNGSGPAGGALQRGAAVDVNRQPWPDRKLFDAVFYRKQGALANVQTKRGCPFTCIYCTYPLIEGRAVRVRQPAGVIGEIKKLVDQGLDYIFFVDNNFNFPVEQAGELCREIIRERLPIRWTAYVNPGFMTDSLGEVMKASGCGALEFGLDTASAAQLLRMGKNFSLDQIREAARICREREIPFCFSLLLGGPGETAATVEETLAEVEALRPTAVICMTGIRIFPGTRLAQISWEEGLLPDKWDPLGPVFYVAQAVRDSLEDRLRAFSENHPNWVFPGLGIDRFPGDTLKMHQLGFTGPLWTYLRPKKRKRGGATA